MHSAHPSSLRDGELEKLHMGLEPSYQRPRMMVPRPGRRQGYLVQMLCKRVDEYADLGGKAAVAGVKRVCDHGQAGMERPRARSERPQGARLDRTRYVGYTEPPAPPVIDADRHPMSWPRIPGSA